MKKEGVFSLLAILILLVSLSFVSANLASDIWDKITGKVTENITEPDCPEIPISRWCPDERTLCPMTTDEQGCSVWDCDACETTPEPPVEETCIEAGGETWAGDPNCCEGLKAVSDCLPDQGCPISLRYCVDCGNGKCEAHENWYNCLTDCEKEEPPGPPPFEPQCVAGEKKSYTCEDGTQIPWCECENDNWVCKISIEDNCPKQEEPKICAASIKITFNKDVYKIGDPVKIIIETFDSQGNHLPNYAFYGQMYDDRWHTPDLQKTDNKGYFIHTGIAEKPAGGVTEVKFKVYTKETSSCGSVEDMAEIKFELGECGIGGCVPEPECKDKIRMCGGVCPPCPEDDEDGEIFYPCRGCDVDGKCYPLGYRKEARYCSDNYEFVNQIKEGKCDNSFECKSNVCISGECVGEGLMRKVIAWFKKMFGGGDDNGESKDCSKLLIEKDIGDYEYEKSGYGENEHSQVPVYSEDGENIGTIKCCMADYSEAATIVCAFDSKEDVRTSLKWILAGGRGTEGFREYKGEKVIANGMIAWTSKAYLIVSGGKPEAGNRFVEDIADAYLKKYPSDLDLTEDDIPVIVHEKPLVFCTEEDEIAAKECMNGGGHMQSDPSALDGTEEGKKSCIKSKGYGEGCCEVYTGCANSCDEITHAPDRWGCYIDLAIKTSDTSICEKIDDSGRRDKCYVNVAEHTGDANICENVDDSSLREKCYFWVAGESDDVEVCEEMADSSLQNECYVGVAEKTGDASFCDKIADSHIGDKCYRDVGIQTNDRSLCEKIIEDRARQKCFDNTS
ncbi:hypothetical protein KAT80_02695 [Candidatus Pacearchaeota archaeon]|nr:hypothetical protein [Candidatus Pacearchaeota archaeon]